MKILVLNCGSSSIKYKLFEMESKEVMAQGGIEGFVPAGETAERRESEVRETDAGTYRWYRVDFGETG